MNGGEDLLRKMGMGSQSEKIIIKGQDFEKMSNLAELLEYQLEELENISNASMSYSRGKPEARILFDQYLMGIYDVTPTHVVTELNNFAPQNTTSIKYKAGDEEYDIIIKDKELAEKVKPNQNNQHHCYRDNLGQNLFCGQIDKCIGYITNNKWNG